MSSRQTVLILDYGAQYTQLIARRIREAHVYCEIHPGTISVEAIRKVDPRAIVLSGGPQSVYDANAPRCDPALFDLGGQFDLGGGAVFLKPALFFDVHGIGSVRNAVTDRLLEDSPAVRIGLRLGLGIPL